LRRRERHRAPIGSQKLRKFKLVAIFLVETKEADGRREQFVEGDLDIGNHLQGKLPHHRHERARCRAGKNARRESRRHG
jgi:hypothetical protein